MRATTTTTATATSTAQQDLELLWKILCFALFSAIIIVIPSLVMAQTPIDSTPGTYICKIADNFLGNTGRGIATIGISVLGVGALLGKITWTQAIIVGVGVSVLFGAPYIITALGALGTCP